MGKKESLAFILKAQTAAAALRVYCCIAVIQNVLYTPLRANYTCSDPLFHYNDHHSSRQLESLTHIATGPQKQAPSNRPITRLITFLMMALYGKVLKLIEYNQLNVCPFRQPWVLVVSCVAKATMLQYTNIIKSKCMFHPK